MTAAPTATEPAGVAALAGVLAALATVSMWGAWVVATRFGVSGTLTPVEVALLRVGPPGLVLMPLFLRQWRDIRRIGWGRALVIVAGAGFPFLLVVGTGMRFAPAADAGALLPGTMPLWVSLFAAALFAERFNPSRLLGLGLIVLGGLCVGGYSLVAGEPGEWRGHLLFLTGAAMWASYTLALRFSGLGPWAAAALVNCVSLLLLLPLALLFGDLRFAASPGEIGAQIVAQGLFSGLLAMAAYGFSVRRLGAARASAFSALTPVIAALLAIPLLGEVPDPLTWFGIAAVVSGVALASGLAQMLRPAPGFAPPPAPPAAP
jgi:drug/metabolite transporter (DMT)-like permease